MLRINDHLFRIDLIRHVFIAPTDGAWWLVVDLMTTADTPDRWPIYQPSREVAEEALETIVEKMREYEDGYDDALF